MENISEEKFEVSVDKQTYVVTPYYYENDNNLRTVFAVLIDDSEVFHIAKNNHDNWIRVNAWKASEANNFDDDQPGYELVLKIGKEIENYFD